MSEGFSLCARFLPVKEKKIKDSVYGYIRIPESIIDTIVDTPVFQRLRRIEQTSGSFRALYPGARHDRFAHSLGVFHLSTIAFERLYDNIRISLSGNAEKISIGDSLTLSDWTRAYFVFSLASLLHDCAHAPFSHAYEKYYQVLQSHIAKGAVEDECLSALDAGLLSVFSIDRDLEDDFIKEGQSSYTLGSTYGSNHEKASAIFVGTYFKERIERAADLVNNDLEEERRFSLKESDYARMGRMIIGCPYRNPANDFDRLTNCLISLLNSSLVDVDGLDYCLRDTHFSGLNNWDLDYDRILSSVTACVQRRVGIRGVNECFARDTIWKEGAQFTIRKSENMGAAIVSGSFRLGFLAESQRDGFLASLANVSEGAEITSVGSTSLSVIDASSFRIECGDLWDGATVTLAKDCTCSFENYSGDIIGSCVVSSNAVEDLFANSTIESYVLAFKPSSLSVIESAIEARNMFHRWAYSHPIAVYQSEFLLHYMMRMSIRFLCCRRYKTEGLTAPVDLNECNHCSSRSCNLETVEGCGDEAHSFEDDVVDVLGLGWLKAFSLFSSTNDQICVENITAPCASALNPSLLCSLSSDDDLNALFKWVYLTNESLAEDVRHKGISTFFGEYFSRPEHRAFWKSYVDFERHKKCSFREKAIRLKFCGDQTIIDDSFTSINTCSFKTAFSEEEYEVLRSATGIEDISHKSIVAVKTSQNVKEIKGDSMYICFEDGSTLRLSDLRCRKNKEQTFEPCVYLYLKD